MQSLKLRTLSHQQQEQYRAAIARTIGAISDEVAGSNKELFELALERIHIFGQLPADDLKHLNECITAIIQDGEYKTQLNLLYNWYRRAL